MPSWFNISNFLTFLRIFLIPFIVYGISIQNWPAVFLLFLVVSATDLLDGFLARLLRQETFLGKVLDPIADKLLLASSFCALAFLQSPSFAIPFWFVILVLFRESLILVGVFSMLSAGIKLEIAPTVWGKLTTLFQLLFIMWLFICYFMSWAPAKTYYTLLILLAIFSVLSLLQYIKIGIGYLDNKRDA